MTTFKKNRHGYSMIEAMITLAIVGMIALYVTMLHTPVVDFFRRGQVHQETSMNIRTSLDIMTHALEQGKATSIHISTPPGPPLLPNSKLDFVLTTPLITGTTAYSFFLSNHNLQMYEYNPNVNVTILAKTLATNVSSLIFAYDTSNPFIVYINLRIEAATKNTSESTAVTQIVNQDIHLEVN